AAPAHAQRAPSRRRDACRAAGSARIRARVALARVVVALVKAGAAGEAAAGSVASSVAVVGRGAWHAGHRAAVVGVGVRNAIAVAVVLARGTLTGARLAHRDAGTQ